MKFKVGDKVRLHQDMFKMNPEWDDLGDYGIVVPEPSSGPFYTRDVVWVKWSGAYDAIAFFPYQVERISGIDRVLNEI